MEERQIIRAGEIAQDMMGAICDGDEEAIKEGFPREIREYCEQGEILDGMEVHRLKAELMQEAGIDETSFFYKKIGIRIGSGEQECDEEVPETEKCSVLFQIGKPFWQGHMGWPFSIDLCLEEEEWKLDESWIREYLLR
ncbi:MAG: hypothetical protein SOT28_01845 [Fusicatenibacter sp.]|nr:hypothetical protein [Lachnospiraceae bacterium]MDY2937050.1 hypothetical protein [Fusicatenibacter sp.]